MQIDPTLRSALAIHSNPGAYALLIGSGVSRAAGIPTGWEVVLDLIGKIADPDGQSTGPDPAAWYRERYHKKPGYSDLLDDLTSTREERMTLLRSYFEPTEEEREEGRKTPTAAHEAIANLVKLGYIRMILTTNFDRLIEQALEAVGIRPDVLSTPEAVHSAMPYTHSSCVVVKLHGDYRDTRIRNTDAELARYPEELDHYLDRVLDDFGLIVCGWSGDWDTALREAILRAPNRRFAYYWFSHGQPTEEAKQLIQHRRAITVPITSADEAFQSLSEKLQSLKEMDQSDPRSIPVTVATVKRFLSETRYRIRLRDLVQKEVKHVWQELNTARFSTEDPPPSVETYPRRVRQHEELAANLVALLTTLSFYDDQNNSQLLTTAIQRLANAPKANEPGQVAWLSLQRYPASLATYASGIAALAAGNYRHLAALLLHPTHYDMNREKSPAIKHLHLISVIDHSLAQSLHPTNRRRPTPDSEHVFDVIRPFISEYVPDEREYEELFDVFEYLIALVYWNDEERWAPLGSFHWRQWGNYGHRDSAVLNEFVLRVQTQAATGDGLLAAGFFNGSLDRFNEVVNSFNIWGREMARSTIW